MVVEVRGAMRPRPSASHVPPVLDPMSETGLFVTPRAAHRLRHALPALAVSALGVMVAALFVGPVLLAPGTVLAALRDGAGQDGAIIRSLRLPRIVLAFGVGGTLAACGAALQAMVRNPLAEPWLLGLSGGAALGAVIGVVAGLPAGWSVSASATIGALSAVALVYRITAVAGRRLDPRVLLLAGVVVSAFAGAVTTALLAVADPFAFRAATVWLFGGFAGASWDAVLRFAVIATPLLGLLWWLARALDLLALGEDTAAMLGADVDRTRRLVILTTSILTATTVSVAGTIGFVGLVVPHALRGLVGPLHRRLLPAVFLAGGAFTVLADAVARTVVRPAELPVGVITALVGVPLFAVLLRRSLA